MVAVRSKFCGESGGTEKLELSMDPSVVQLLRMVQLLRRETGTGLSLAVHCCAASAYGPVIEKGDWYWAFIGCSVLCSFWLWFSY